MATTAEIVTIIGLIIIVLTVGFMFYYLLVDLIETIKEKKYNKLTRN